MSSVEATPSPNTSMYEKYLVEMELRFFSSMASIDVFESEYGGYRPLFKKWSKCSKLNKQFKPDRQKDTYEASFSPSELKFLTRHDFLCENVSNEYFPW